jgi:hypothetical protein
MRNGTCVFTARTSGKTSNCFKNVCSEKDEATQNTAATRLLCNLALDLAAWLGHSIRGPFAGFKKNNAGRARLSPAYAMPEGRGSAAEEKHETADIKRTSCPYSDSSHRFRIVMASAGSGFSGVTVRSGLIRRADSGQGLFQAPTSAEAPAQRLRTSGSAPVTVPCPRGEQPKRSPDARASTRKERTLHLSCPPGAARRRPAPTVSQEEMLLSPR